MAFEKLKQTWTKWFALSPKELSGVVTTGGSYFGHFGFGPKQFVPTPFNPDDLVKKKGIKIYRKMALDEQIKSALLAKKFAVVSTGFEIQKPVSDMMSEKVSKERVDFVNFNFEEMEGSFDGKILDLLSALDFGFSVAEKELWNIDFGPFKGKFGLKDLLARPPDDIEFETDQTGRLTENGVWQFQNHFPRDKFVIYSYNKKFGNVYGESDLRAAYRPFWSKDNMMKLLAITLERYGEPLIVITHEGTLTDAQHDDLTSLLKNLQVRSGLIIPKGVTLDLKSAPPRTAEAFLPVLNYYDQLMRIAILMPGLLGLSEESQVGSFARAVKEFDVFLWILGQLRKDIETVIEEQIIKPLIDLNYNVEHGQYPRFRFKEVTEEARFKQYELYLLGLGAGGMTKTLEDENKLRELIGIGPLNEELAKAEKEERMKNLPQFVQRPKDDDDDDDKKERPFSFRGGSVKTEADLVKYINSVIAHNRKGGDNG